MKSQEQRRRLIKIANHVYPVLGTCPRKVKARNEKIDRWMLVMTLTFRDKSEEWKEAKFKELEDEFVKENEQHAVNI